MKRFLLVDLWSQAAYIPNFVRCLPPSAFLVWLRWFGDVTTWPTDGGVAGYFKSPYGPEASFELTDDGHLFLIGDNWTQRVW
jgi:hypothetical protein